MEVHAHSHTARKKWTHYLWEFLMLFLAVFCGFMAENKREHIVENRREKEYMKMLINDLVTDSSSIERAVQENKDIMKGLDSLVSAFDSLDITNKKQLLAVYFLFYTWGSTPSFVSYSERSISQLRTSGGMRLIRKQIVSDSIVFYYAGTEFCLKQETAYFDDMTHLIELSYKIFDKLYLEKGHENMWLAQKMIRENPALVREFINRTRDLSEVIGSYNNILRVMNFLGSNLKKLIIREYHL
jgi:hypothetical protein